MSVFQRILGKNLDGTPVRSNTYSFKFEWKGKQILRGGFETQTAAKKAEAEARKACEAGHLKEVNAWRRRAEPVKFATIGQLCTAYENLPCDAKRTVRETNANALKRVVRITQHRTPETNVDTLSTSLLNDKLVQEYFAVIRQRIETLTQAEQLTAKKSANSELNQAKGCLLPKVAARLRRKEGDREPLSLPDFTAFERAWKEERFGRLPGSSYNPPADDVIAATFKAWLELDDRNLFLAIGHELAFGLRKGELGQACWSWHTQREGYPVLDSTSTGAEVKNKTALIQVRALDPWYNQMMTRARAKDWLGKPDDYIITGSDRIRTWETFNQVSTWMKNLGWKTKKTNHALRAYAGSQVIMRYGSYEAQTWLRHSSVQVTERFYSYFVKRFRPADPETLPAKWATIQSTFVPQVVPKPAVA